MHPAQRRSDQAAPNASGGVVSCLPNLHAILLFEQKNLHPKYSFSPLHVFAPSAIYASLPLSIPPRPFKLLNESHHQIPQLFRIAQEWTMRRPHRPHRPIDATALHHHFLHSCRDSLVLGTDYVTSTAIKDSVRPGRRRTGRAQRGGGLQAQLADGDGVGRGRYVCVEHGFGIGWEEIAVGLGI